MEKNKFDIAQKEICNALHLYQEAGGGFDDVLAAIEEVVAWLPEGRIKAYLSSWLASKGEPNQLRYDKLAAYWAGLWAAEECGE